MDFDKKFDGKYLGNLGQYFGFNSKIEINKIDCWLNQSRNITLIINDGENKIRCSQSLSEIIRKYKLDEKTNELKKYSVYEFVDGAKFVTHLIENNFFNKKSDSYNLFELRQLQIKELTKNNELYVAKQTRVDGTFYLTISDSKVKEVVTEIIKQLCQSDKKIIFTKDEVYNAIKLLSYSKNTSSKLKEGYYLGKQASIFDDFSEARFSIFGKGILALVKVNCDVRYFE
jgi:hypothetical protein